MQDGGWYRQSVALCALPGHRPLRGLRDLRWLCLVVHMGSCMSSPPLAGRAISNLRVLNLILIPAGQYLRHVYGADAGTGGVGLCRI